MGICEIQVLANKSRSFSNEKMSTVDNAPKLKKKLFNVYTV